MRQLLLSLYIIQYTNKKSSVVITPRENPRRGPRYKSGAFSTLGRSLGFSSGGLKENSQNPDTVEAKTVKTKIKTKSGKKWGKSAISCDNFERL